LNILEKESTHRARGKAGMIFRAFGEGCGVLFVPETEKQSMKKAHLLVATIAAALAFAPVLAEDTTKPEASDQTKEQKSGGMGMMGKDMGDMMGMMGMGDMMSNWKDQQAELDKLVADMNSAPSDKKVDAIAAVVTKLVEHRKAMHERMQKMMSEGREEMMKMGRMMMMMRMMDMMTHGDKENKEESEHAQHH
jgi:hypothetical protein